METADVIIIGGGIAGLVTASELAKSKLNVLVLEAEARVGGRIQSTRASVPLQLGAEFIHGAAPLTKKLLKQYGIAYYTVTGNIMRKQKDMLIKREDFIDHWELLVRKLEELEEDTPVSDFLNRYFSSELYSDLRKSVTQYVEGYDAGDAGRYSSFALKEDLSADNEEQCGIEGGYDKLVDALHEACLNAGCAIYTGQVVSEIKWSKGYVDVYTLAEHFECKAVVVTASLGVLQGDVLTFAPPLPFMPLAKQLGYGPVIKCLVELDAIFWHDLKKHLMRESTEKDFFFLFSEETIPTWWTHEPKADSILTGWLAGPQALKMAGLSDDEILKLALQSLAGIFEVEEGVLNNFILRSAIANWKAKPFFNGAYSYRTVGDNAILNLFTEGADSTIFFAGEAFSGTSDSGTVEAALQSGLRVVKQVSEVFK